MQGLLRHCLTTLYLYPTGVHSHALLTIQAWTQATVMIAGLCTSNVRYITMFGEN